MYVCRQDEYSVMPQSYYLTICLYVSVYVCLQDEYSVVPQSSYLTICLYVCLSAG